MGTWGEKAFQNDSALDWLAELQAGDLVALRAALRAVVESDGEIDEWDGSAAIAAAEIVAAGRGRGADRLSEQAGAWLDAHRGSLSAGDVQLARRALERVAAPGSELYDLWLVNGADNAWQADVRDLLERLEGDWGSVGSDPPEPEPHESAGGGAFAERDKQVLVTFLGARGLEPTAQQLARIQASRDAAEVQRWLARCVGAISVEALFDD